VVSFGAPHNSTLNIFESGNDSLTKPKNGATLASTRALVQFAASFDAPANELPVVEQKPAEIQICSGNSVWEFNEAVYGVMMNDYYTGWFDPEDDEIPESALQPIIDRLTAK
jgi:hypothetical protein